MTGVCVVGMHRSGTSLVMGVLARLGLDVGPVHSLVPAIVEDNPDGYLEQQAIVALDDELLAALGGHTSDPAPVAPGWHAGPRFAPQRARAGELMRTTFAGSPWGWKDPRAALLLPFWRSVVPGLRVVICVRNPAEVATSMMRRHDHPPWEHWPRMWLRYTADALRDSAGAERMGLVYEDLLAEPEREVGRLGRFLLGAAPDPGDVAAACEAVRPGTRRHTVSDAELTGHPGVPPEAAAAYLAVRAAVRAGEPLDAVAQLVPGLHAALRERDAPAGELERLRAQLALLAGSRSWRLTAPLRSIADGARARRDRRR